jgi:RNA polymerase sigma factor (sigma-70 family)
LRRLHARKGVERIMGLAPPAFVDETGQPLPAHIQSALRSLLPRFRREFPTLQDEAIITDIVEAAGRKIAEAERRLGPLEDGLHGYAWVTLRSVALSRFRRVRDGLNKATLEVSDNLGSASDSPGTPEAIEREILLREIFAMLTPDERRVALMKKAGYSSQEIADRRGSSAAAVDMMYSRVRAKIRAALEPGAPAPARRGPRPVVGGEREK